MKKKLRWVRLDVKSGKNEKAKLGYRSKSGKNENSQVRLGRPGGSILKLGGPNTDIRFWALIVQNIGGARLYVLLYFRQILGGPRPPLPIPFRRACIVVLTEKRAAHRFFFRPVCRHLVTLQTCQTQQSTQK